MPPSGPNPYWRFNYFAGTWEPTEENPGGIHGQKPEADPPDYDPEGNYDPENPYSSTPIDPADQYPKWDLDGSTGSDWWLEGVLNQLYDEGWTEEDLAPYIDQWYQFDESVREQLMTATPNNYGQAWEQAMAAQNEIDLHNDTDPGRTQFSQQQIDDFGSMTAQEFIQTYGYGMWEQMRRNGEQGGRGGPQPGAPTEPPEGNPHQAQLDQYQALYDSFGTDLEGFLQALDYYEDGQSGYSMGPRPPLPNIENYDFDFSQLRESEIERLTALGYDPFWEPDPDADGDGNGNGTPIVPDPNDDYLTEAQNAPTGNESANIVGENRMGAPTTPGGSAYATAGSGQTDSSKPPAVDPSLLQSQAGNSTTFTSSPGTGLSVAFGSARTGRTDPGRAQDANKKRPQDDPRTNTGQNKNATWGGGWR